MNFKWIKYTDTCAYKNGEYHCGLNSYDDCDEDAQSYYGCYYKKQNVFGGYIFIVQINLGIDGEFVFLDEEKAKRKVITVALARLQGIFPKLKTNASIKEIIESPEEWDTDCFCYDKTC